MMLRRRRRLVTTLAVLSLLFAVAVPAGAVLERMGPVSVDPTIGGFPAYFQDKSGLAMEFCNLLNQAELDKGWCVLIPPGPLFPEHFPDNFFIEHFYHDAVALVTDGTTKARLVMAIEASFANGAVPVPGEQMTFGRIRVFITGLPFSGTYTIYHPYGVWTFPNMAAGDRLFFTEDIGVGCVGTFTCTLGTSIGPFLLPSPAPGGPEVPPIPDLVAGQDPFYDALVAAGGATPYPATGKKYIADPARIGPVTGSPLAPFVGSDGVTYNHNTFRIEGPNGYVLQTNNFSLGGRIMTGSLAGRVAVDRASYATIGTQFKLDVFASGFPTVAGRVPAQPTPPTTLPILTFYEAACGGAIDPLTGAVLPPPYTAPLAPEHAMANTGNYFWAQSLAAALPNPPYVCVEDATARNAAGQVVPAFYLKQLTDDVSIANPLTAGQLPAAYYDGPGGGNLTVKAGSSDTSVPGPTLTLTGFGLGGTGLPLVAGSATVTGLTAPPAKVQVVSSAGGSADLLVTTAAGAAVIAGVPVAVNDELTIFEDCSPVPASSCATPLLIAPLANDTYNGGPIPAGAILTITQPPRIGTMVLNADNTISYTPNPNINGTEGIGYTVTVNGVASNQAYITIAIAPVNDPPVAINDTTGAVRGVANSVNVLANDVDPDGAADLAGAVIVTGNASLGIAAGTVFPGGVVTFTPPSTTAAGPYTFTYNAQDVAGLLSATPATVTVNVATAEAIIPASAIYTQAKGRWTVKGTASPIQGQTLTIAYEPGTAATYKVAGACTGNAAGTQIGTVTVDAFGNWLLDFILSSTAGVLNPSNTGGNSTGFWCTPPKTLRITDTRGATVGTATIGISLK